MSSSPGKPQKAPAKGKGVEEEVEKKPEPPVDLQVQAAPRGKIYDNIMQTVGGTPLVRLPRFKARYGLEADIMAKLEFFNPLASVKDRAVIAMFEAAETNKLITPGKTTLIEATSGNSGISLAAIAAAKGYKMILVMPESVPFERRKVLSFFGPELVLTPADTGMHGAVEKAREIARESKDETYIFDMFEKSVNVQMHAKTTAEEIWADTEGRVDIIIAGVGTGSTITGIAQALRPRKESLQIIAVEPEESAVLSGQKPKQHEIQGIGAGFVPPLLDVKLMDGVVTISSARAFEIAREVAKLDGIPCGISSGAALAAAIEVAGMDENKGKMIVVIFPSFSERYTSTPLYQKL